MKENITISTDQSILDISIIENFLTKESYWAKGRDRKVIEKSIANSLCFGAYLNDNTLIGFARVVTDYAVFAWIMDVFVIEEHRNKGVGKLLLSKIVNHPDLQNLKRWGLSTEDAHGLYEQFGFRVIGTPASMMEKIP